MPLNLPIQKAFKPLKAAVAKAKTIKRAVEQKQLCHTPWGKSYLNTQNNDEKTMDRCDEDKQSEETKITH